MKILVEGKHGHGALPKKYDIRDHKSSKLGMAPVPFNWDAGFDVTIKTGFFPVENQGESGSCGGQAARYYLEVLKCLQKGTFERLSAKDPYCQIFYPGGGTDIRSIGKICVRGIRSEILVPSYENDEPPSEFFMEDKNMSNSAAPIFFKADAYAFSKTDIESIAQSVRDNDGCIIQVNGQNNGTWLSAFPKPPSRREWGHFLYAGKAKRINGKKYVKCCNSWGGDVGEDGWQWLGEDYFSSRNVTNALVFYNSRVTPYVPTSTQAAINSMPSWLIRLFNWLGNYLH